MGAGVLFILFGILGGNITQGILLGLVQVVWEHTPIGLGISGSILVVGLVTGWARSSYPLFGGIPATGAIARTATNIRAGGRTPVHALWKNRWRRVATLAAVPETAP